MLPNMARTLKRYEQNIILRTQTLIEGGFEDSYTPLDTTIRAVVQVASDRTLQALEIDYSLDYQTVHMNNTQKNENDELIVPRNNDLIVYDEMVYKIIKLRNYSRYGFYEMVIEELKNGSNS